MKAIFSLIVVVALSLAGCSGSSASDEETTTPTTTSHTESTVRGNSPVSTHPVAIIETSKGTIKIQLNQEKAPRSVENFIAYVNDGFYDGTIFHRVIPGFMIQGGGMNTDMSKKSTKAPIQNEANNGLKNNRGTVAMARTSVPHSASSQFFINVSDNDSLNFSSETPQGWGYAVFAEVTEGMEVVDAIVSVATGSQGGHQDVPVEPITINTVTLE